MKTKGKHMSAARWAYRKQRIEIVKSVILLMAIQWGKQAWGSINCRLLLVISSLPLVELRVFTFYLNFTDLTTQVDLSSLPVAALPNSFLCYYTKLWHLSSNLYRHTLKTVDTRFQFPGRRQTYRRCGHTSLDFKHLMVQALLIKEPSSKTG